MPYIKAFYYNLFTEPYSSFFCALYTNTLLTLLRALDTHLIALKYIVLLSIVCICFLYQINLNLLT